MALSSMRFAFDARLQQVAENNPTMKRGETGESVASVQSALVDLGYSMPITTNNGRRQPDGIFGQETENVVRQYQRTEGLSPDGIVGRFTIASLDEAMRAQEEALIPSSGFGGPLLGSVIKAPATQKKISFVIVTEMNAPWFGWAKQIKKTLGSIGADFVEIPNGASVSTVASRLKKAATKAGPRGILVMSVGHGGVVDAVSKEEGFFDLGPKGSFPLGGMNAVLPGDPIPPGKKVHPVRASAYYDLRVPNKILKGGFAPSRKDEDEASGGQMAKVRLNNFKQYMDVCDTFKKTGLACVVLLTCKVGASSGFIKRVRQQWGTPIVGYNRRVVGQEQESGRTRIFLEGDAPGKGTNIAFGEFFVPMGPGMVAFP
ncbi:MAG: peptidoglycan-binding domain-containing protein [Isosphaeraceae bacterium]